MSTTLERVDEKSIKIKWNLTVKTTERRRWQAVMALYYSGKQIAVMHAPKDWNGNDWVYKAADFVGTGAAYTWDNLPPSCEMRFESNGQHYRNGTWVDQARSSGSGFLTGPMSTSHSVAAKSYNSGTLTIKVLKNRYSAAAGIAASYKIFAKVERSVGSGYWQEELTKTFRFDPVYAATAQRTFEITGLSQNTTYRITYSISEVLDASWGSAKGTECYGGTFTTGSFTTPKRGAYNPGVTITNVEQIPLTHKARVYWTVAEGSTASTYKIFYTNASGTYVDGGTVTVSQNGYNDITVADLSATRDVSFVVRCYPINTSQTVYTEDHVDSNAVACKMYKEFEWTYPKVQGEKGIVSAEEWNRCKVWVHAKNSDFVIPAETGEYEPITDEAIQDVFDALDLDYSVDDGSAITAAMYNDIADAINEEE